MKLNTKQIKNKGSKTKIEQQLIKLTKANQKKEKLFEKIMEKLANFNKQNENKGQVNFSESSSVKKI